jgi:6-bladed beta-propeller
MPSPHNAATHHSRIAVFLATLGFLAACSVHDRAPGVVVRDSAGIVIVENDWVHPVWSGDEAWRLSEQPAIRIGTVSGDSTQQLYQVVDSHRLADGRIAVVNTGTSEIRIYDGTGLFQSVIGGRGAGPGEFRNPWSVQEIPGDSILVVDLGREISIFDSNGVFHRRFSPVRPDGQPGGEGFEPVGQFGDGSLLFRSHYREDPARTGLGRSRIRMERTMLDGRAGGSFGDFDDQAVLFGGPGPYLFGAWAKEAAGDSTMWYGPGDRFEIREVAFDGRTLRLVRLAKPPSAVTQADVDQIKASALEQARGTRNEAFMNRYFAAAQFPERFPAHFEMEMDAEGDLWVQDYRSFTRRVDRSWAVFDRDGRFLGEVVVPAGVTVHEIGDDYVLGVWTDELDVEYVVMYDLIKPVPR